MQRRSRAKPAIKEPSNGTTRVYKAQWPMAGLRLAWVYAEEDSHLLPFARPTFYLPATPQIRQAVFQGRFLLVYFLGSMIYGLAPEISEFVRREEWIEHDPLTGELVP